MRVSRVGVVGEFNQTAGSLAEANVLHLKYAETFEGSLGVTPAPSSRDQKHIKLAR